MKKKIKIHAEQHRHQCLNLKARTLVPDSVVRSLSIYLSIYIYIYIYIILSRLLFSILSEGKQIFNYLLQEKVHTVNYTCSFTFDRFTYLLTPWCRVLLDKLTGLQLVKKFPAFHGTRMFITALTSVRHLSLSWASPIQSIYPHPTSSRSVLILSTHLHLGLPSGLFPSGFPIKTLYTPLSSPISSTLAK